VSIRLRLTLLYSALVALTLIGFSTALYVAQSQSTLDAIKDGLITQADRFANGPRRFGGIPDEAPPGGNLPGRWTQMRAPDGTVIARTTDLISTTLPLSAEGLRAVQSGSTWTETALVEEGRVLIFSRPLPSSSGTGNTVQVAAPIAEREQALSNLRYILIVGSVLVSLIAFAIGWLLGGTALSPIHRITRTAQAIGDQHDFSRRVRHEGPNDEVGRLAVTFNTMLSELETAYRRLQQALESQRRFVADASHELRTPLTTVRGNIELLSHNPPLEAKEQADVVADTKDEVERLIRLVNQLLVLARTDSGRSLRHEPLPVKPLLEDACRQISSRARRHTITCDALADIMVLGDRDAIRQVLIILLDNALVHTPPGAKISVTSAVIGGRGALSVRDTGLGIGPNDLPHLFERFYRGDISRSGAGAGLGLAIAKELVEGQGGTIDVESKPGMGTVFTVLLPQPEGKTHESLAAA
jgi:signal transduction histidine kinase